MCACIGNTEPNKNNSITSDTLKKKDFGLRIISIILITGSKFHISIISAGRDAAPTEQDKDEWKNIYTVIIYNHEHQTRTQMYFYV